MRVVVELEECLSGVSPLPEINITMWDEDVQVGYFDLNVVRVDNGVHVYHDYLESFRSGAGIPRQLIIAAQAPLEQLCHEFDVPILHEARFMKEKEEARAKLARYLLANGYRRVPLPECIINSTLEIWYKQFVPPGVCLRYHGRKSVFADRNLA